MTEDQLNKKLFSISNKVENTLPPQTGNAGKVLSTDGLKALWVASSSTGIIDGSITNAKLANVPTATLKGRTTSGTGVPQDLTVAQVKTLLNLQGTNNGDETTSSIKTKLGITTLTGTNTGDQDISGIATNTAAIGTLSSLTTSDQTNIVNALNEVKLVADTAAGGGTVVGDGTVTNAKLATDVKVGSLASLTTTSKSNLVVAINEVKSIADAASSGAVPGDGTITNLKLATDVKVGSLATLSTTAKSTVVAAINELYTNKANTSALGTAAALNVPASGNAASGEVVKGTDTRLSDSRTPVSHTHVAASITDFQTTVTANTTVAANNTAIGTLSSLTTTAKSNLVVAINEVKATADAAGIGTVGDGSITNVKLANVATATIKGRATSGTGSPEDLTVTQVKTLLSLNNVNNTADASKTFTASQISNFNSAVDALVPIRNFDDLYFQGDGITTAYTVIKADVATKVNPRVLSVTSSATVTPNADTYDGVSITAQAVGLTLANWIGTPLNMQAMIIRINDNGSAQSITYGSQYRALGVTLPTTTVANKTLYLACIWNSLASKIDVIGTPVQA
jgi:hypothetical protein